VNDTLDIPTAMRCCGLWPIGCDPAPASSTPGTTGGDEFAILQT
jgi:hypothetical protein